MGIMTRLTRLWKADLHGVMDQMEDRELLMRQYLREMEHSLQQKEARLHLMSRTQRQIEADVADRQQEIDKLERDLALALRKDKDEIARLLIRKQRLQQKQLDHLGKQLDNLRQEQRCLAQVLEEQRLRYETLKVKAASACRSAVQGSSWNDGVGIPEQGGTFVVDDEEIELELIRRKEEITQQNGGEA